MRPEKQKSIAARLTTSFVAAMFAIAAMLPSPTAAQDSPGEGASATQAIEGDRTGPFPTQPRARAGSRLGMRDRDDAAEATGAAVGEAPERARPQARTQIDRQAPRRSMGNLHAGPSAVGLPTFVVSPATQQTTLYFRPSQIQTEPGGRFQVSLSLYNPAARNIEAFEIWLQYDPELLEPISVDTAPLARSLEEPMKCQVWSGRGLIRLAGDFRQPFNQVNDDLVTLQWRAADRPGTALIELEAPGDQSNRLLVGGINELETSKIGNRGSVDARVTIMGESRGRRIVPAGPDAQPDFSPDDAAPEDVPQAELPLDIAAAQTRGAELRLRHRVEPHLPEGVEIVEVVLENPERIPFDEAVVDLRFDPQSTLVLDVETDGPVEQGMTRRPRVEEIAPSEAAVRLRTSTAMAHRPAREEVLARIYYRPLRAEPAERFAFAREDFIRGHRLNDVLLAGRSILAAEAGREITSGNPAYQTYPRSAASTWRGSAAAPSTH